MTRGVLLVGLLISALLAAWLTLQRNAKPAAGSARAGPSAELTPDDVRRDPEAAKKQIVSENCTQPCQSAAGVCRSMADGATAEAACDKERSACEASCKATGEPPR